MKYTIIKLLKLLRPSFYNRITWIVIITGTTILSKPLWLDLVNMIFETNLDISITGKHDELVGLSVITIGLLYNIGYRHIEIKSVQKANNEDNRIHEHDLKIFKSETNIISESFIHNFLDLLIGDESTSLNKMKKINDFIDESKLISNNYLNSELKNIKQKLVNDLEHLEDYIGDHFFSYPRGNSFDGTRLCMRPELNIDREGDGSPETEQKHIEYRQELVKRGNSVKKSYNEYRNKIKEILKV